MITHYFECNILGTDNPPEFILGKLYKNIHGILSEKELTNIGISFPQMDKRPGRDIRLFGDQKTLSGIHANPGIQFFVKSGAISVSDIQPVPKKHSLATFARVRVAEKTTDLYALKSELRFVKHLAKKGIEIDEDKLKDHRKKIIARRKKVIPFLLMHSKSTQRDFPLFLEKEEVDSHGPGSGFNFYGLSNREAPVAVPVF